MDWDYVRHVRRAARALLALGGAMLFVPVVLYVFAPHSTSPMYQPEIATIPTSILVPALGYAGMVFGSVWMWRIYRAPTKDEAPTWRYRDR